MATDRESASRLVNILEEVGFTHIWVPENKGTDDSWGELLNENFATIVRTFVVVDERIISNDGDISSARNLADTANNKALLNAISITAINNILSSISSDVSSVKAEMEYARGNKSSLDARLDVSFDDNGIRKANVIMSGIFTANYESKEITYSEQTSALDVTASLPGETLGDGSDYGLITVAKAGDASETDNICHVHESGQPYLTENGYSVYGRAVRSDSSLYLYSYYLDADNVQQTFNVPSGQVLDVMFPKIYDYYTTPKLNQLHNYAHNIPKATDNDYGISKMGSGGGLNSDRVDGLHASASASNGKLFPLNNNSRFGDERIEVNDSVEGINSLDAYYPRLLKTRVGDINKNISHYIGSLGSELFVKVTVSGIGGSVVNDFGGQFTRSIAVLEGQIDSNIANISTNASDISYNNALIDIINDTTIPAVIDGYGIADAALKTEIQAAASGDLITHASNINAHHRADCSGVNIRPNSVTTPYGSIDTLVSNYAQIQQLSCVDAVVSNMTVETFNKITATEAVYSDRFIELSYIETSGIPISNAISTSGIAFNDEYRVGFLLHRGNETRVSGVVTAIDDKAALVRYNITTDTLELCKDWQHYSQDDELLGNPDNNTFIDIGEDDDHNDLDGIQGGTSDEYFHVTSAQHTTLTNFADNNTVNTSGTITIASGQTINVTETLDSVETDDKLLVVDVSDSDTLKYITADDLEVGGGGAGGDFEISFPAGSWDYPTTNFAPWDSDAQSNGSMRRQLFDDTTAESVESQFVLPSAIAGTVTFEIYGYAATAPGAAKNVEFTFYHSAKADGEDWDIAYDDEDSGALAVDPTDAPPDPAYLDHFTFTRTVTNLGWTANDHVRIKLTRKVAGNDDLEADYGVVNFRIIVPRA